MSFACTRLTIDKDGGLFALYGAFYLWANWLENCLLSCILGENFPELDYFEFGYLSLHTNKISGCWIAFFPSFRLQLFILEKWTDTQHNNDWNEILFRSNCKILDGHFILLLCFFLRCWFWSLSFWNNLTGFFFFTKPEIDPRLFTLKFFRDGDRFFLIFKKLNRLSSVLLINKLLFSSSRRFRPSLLWLQIGINSEMAKIHILVLLEPFKNLLLWICLKLFNLVH